MQCLLLERHKKTIITVMAVHDGICPPTINLENLDPEVGDFNLVPNVAQKRDIQYEEGGIAMKKHTKQWQ